MNYKLVNNVSGWVIFLIAFVVYALTVSPTGSFWDCGEFVAVSNELQVPHPPGAPMYLLIGRIFAVFAPSPESVAFMVNMFSVIASAFTALFTFWIVTMLGKKIIAPNHNGEWNAPTQSQTLGLIFAGAVGALTCTFCDSVWFNAVEAEVYAPSSFFTALVVWLMLKWDARADEKDNLKWILLIAYVMGLSVGVHLLNLLTIPALGMIYYFRKYKFSYVSFGTCLALSVFILLVINSGVIKHTFQWAMNFELFFTGSYEPSSGNISGLGLPFGTGTFLFATLLFGGLIYCAWASYQGKRNEVTSILLAFILIFLGLGNVVLAVIGAAVIGAIIKYSEGSFQVPNVVLNTISMGLVLVYLGVSSYSIIYLRSQANPPINENNPSNILLFLSYMNRDQYGDWPILHGPTYNARGYLKDEPGGPMYYKFLTPQDNKQWSEKETNMEALNSRYVVYARKENVDYMEGSERFFPRMHSPTHYTGKGEYSYFNFVKDKGESMEDPYDDKPTGSDNIRFFIEYQLKYMYIRYFAWNFIGRQGDEQFRVDDWESGLMGTKKDMPEYIAKDPSRNHYYFLPFLLGILGLVWQSYRRKEDSLIVAALFFFTGLAIILYLNQTPMQPRERDYSYAGSFQTFSIWVGLGVLAIIEWLDKLSKNKMQKATPVIAGILSLALVPGNMAAQNWDDHSRAGNYVAPDSAHNMLNSCAKNAILFTNGDNDTFPLWYLQEVEGVRTDVRVINLSLVNTDWYIHQLKLPLNDAPPLKLSMQESDYMGEKNGRKDVKEAEIFYKLPVNKAQLLADGIISPSDSDKIVSPMEWKIKTQGGEGRRYLLKQDLVIIDLVRNNAENGWKIPIYFAVTIPTSSFVSLNDYFQLEGMAYRVLPVKYGNRRGDERINRAVMFENLTKKYKLRGMDNDKVFYSSDIKRMIGNLRHNYIRLSDDYLQENERLAVELDTLSKSKNADPTRVNALRATIKDNYDKAVYLTDFVTTKISDKACRTDGYYATSFAKAYLEAGKFSNDAKLKEKGKQFLALSAARTLEDLKYDRASEGVLRYNNPNLHALQDCFRMAKDDLKDMTLADKIGQDLFVYHSAVIEDFDKTGESGGLEKIMPYVGYGWNLMINFYKSEMKNPAKAMEIAKRFQEFTGDSYFIDDLQGKVTPPPMPAQQQQQAKQQEGDPEPLSIDLN
jgi:hypothetical protein